MTHANQLTTTNNLLSHFLSAPDLVKKIQSLPARSLLQIINKIGLQDSAEILALATTAQLTKMVDEDLWVQDRPGEVERFSADRLSVWLAALLEIGAEKAAEKLGEMDEEFLTYAFQNYLHAIDLEALQFMRAMVQGDSWEDERLESLLDNHNTHEMSGVLVLAKATAPWDAILDILLALDNYDTSLCGRILQRLVAATEEKAEKEGGLYEVLSQEEMLEADSLFSRNQRRSQEGFVPAEDANAFIAWVENTPAEEIRNRKGRDPVSRAYFREFAGTLAAPIQIETSGKADLFLAEWIEAESAPLLLGSTSPMAQGLAVQGDQEDRTRFLMELAFLAQVMMLTSP